MQCFETSVPLASGQQMRRVVGVRVASATIPRLFFPDALSAAQVGAVLVSINPAYRAAELSHALCQAGVSLLVLAQEVRVGPLFRSRLKPGQARPSLTCLTGCCHQPGHGSCGSMQRPHRLG
jgi:hypothetical protein